MNPFKGKPRLGGNCSRVRVVRQPSPASYTKNKTEVKATTYCQFPPSNETVTNGVVSYLGENSSDNRKFDTRTVNTPTPGGSLTRTIGTEEEASTRGGIDGTNVSVSTMTKGGLEF